MLEKAVADMIEIEAKINRQIADLANLRLKIADEIHQLKKERSIEILFRRYILLETFEHIADALGLSFKYTLNAHGKALKEFQKNRTEKVMEALRECKENRTEKNVE